MIRIELEKLLNGRSLYWLSKQSGTRWATLAGMVNGTAQRIELEALEKICDALECTPGDLLTKVERKPRKKDK
jgi:putative transcriptional regulator